MNLQQVSDELNIPLITLEQESIKTFLEKKLNTIEVSLFILSKKYGIKNIFEFDNAIKEGKFHEENSYEEYFEFDHLEAERKKIISLLEKLWWIIEKI